MRSLSADADRNFVASYRTLVEHIPGAEMRQFGTVLAFTTGLPLGLFNGAIVVQPATANDLAAALRWLRATRLTHRAWMRVELGAELAAVAEAAGYAPDPRRYPAMALCPVPEPPAPPDGVTIRAVHGEAALTALRSVLEQDGLAPELARRLLSASLAEDPNVRLFCAFVDDRPAGTSIAIRSGDVSGVYGVETVAETRRRGVGTAVTWAAVEAGRDWGCASIVLQSTEMAERLYERMGFRTVAAYVTFRPLAT